MPLQCLWQIVLNKRPAISHKTRKKAEKAYPIQKIADINWNREPGSEVKYLPKSTSWVANQEVIDRKFIITSYSLDFLSFLTIFSSKICL